MNCRHCHTKITNVFVDLGQSPPSNSYLSKDELHKLEINYPLKVFVCHECFLVQLNEYKPHNEIFTQDYAYFSSFSTTWLKHAHDYVESITNKLKLGKHSYVTEIASNDGYLLKNFIKKGIPCVGVEPTKNTAEVAKSKGIQVVEDFFSLQLAQRLKKSNLIICNNVLAHVPNINDFVKGLKILLENGGTITVEFPHLLNLIKLFQFDTIYHEHYSYLSLYTSKIIFNYFGLEIYDVEKINTHGGSLRLYCKHLNDSSIQQSESVEKIINEEIDFGLNKLSSYSNFISEVLEIKNKTLDFLRNAKKENKKVIAYGAAAKGNTFLNFCGIRSDLIPFIVDKSPYKQNKFLPGSNIPIYQNEIIKSSKPDYIIILPWNLKDEISQQLNYIRGWDGKFVCAIPNFEIF